MTTEVTLTMRGGAAWADSREVAKSFSMGHSDVLKDIARIRAGIGKNPDTPWFVECSEVNRQNGQTYRHFEMTRDGFSLLAMGWTGAKALAFKVAYIDRFNAMEAALKAQELPALPDFSNPVLAARAWADDYEAKLLGQRTADERAVLLAEQRRSRRHLPQIGGVTPQMAGPGSLNALLAG